MRLIRCHIENFGRLHDLDVEFDPEFHLISEQNGWGKSTLAAFVRVMFFGFEGENRRSGLENERKRFVPWQGGTYGGQITFETGGKTYTAARVFGDKKASDIFDLRDAGTNLNSDDFTEDLGEEIFRINGESFERTVFIRQNDCATAATDSINARISNITDNMNDLDCYEKASASLRDALLKLTPRRKTGRLSRINDEITEMQTEIRQNASLEDAIRECSERENEARRELSDNRTQLDKVFELAGQVSRAKDRQTKRAEYSRLCAACVQTEEAHRLAEDRFPGEVPSEDEIREAIKACGEMERAAEGMKIYELTPEECRELSDPETAAGDADAGTEHESSFPEPEPESADAEEENADEFPEELQYQEQSTGIGWLAAVICGIVLAAAGLIIYFWFFTNWPWLIAAAAGAALILIGCLLRRSGRIKAEAENEAIERMRRELAEQQEALERERRARREALEREREARREALERERMARLDTLREKQRNYQRSLELYEEKRSEAEELIRRVGRTPEEPLGTQIQTIWRQRVDWQTAKREAGEALRDKQRFESQNDMSFLIADEKTEELPSMEELHSVQQQLENAAEQIRERADAYGKRLGELREKYDEVVETRERLAAAEEERDRLKEQYGMTELALESLTTAKETLTAKYMEPLMTSFSKYYGILTGEPGEGALGAAGQSGDDTRISASQYRMDANTNLTVEEHGMQRDTKYLSRGYQDMIGLCLRLALVDAMYQDEKPFLIMDDPFVNLDEHNRAGGKRLMESVIRQYQVIYLTCRG